MPLATQLGYKKETTYGTAVVVDTFHEYESEGIAPVVERYDSPALRTTIGPRDDRFVPWVAGYDGPLTIPVMTKGFGWWIEFMTGGNVTTTGPTETVVYTHTFNIASLCDDSFTLQVDRPLGVCGDDDQAFTYAGCKVSEWTLTQEAGGVLTAELSIMAQTGTTATAKATATYVTGNELIPWTNTSLTIGGTAVPVKSWSVSCSNQLEDRRMINGTAFRAKPVENAYRDITFSCTCDFEALATIYNRVVSATAAGTLAAVVVTANGPTLLGSSIYPGLTVTMPAVRFDEGFPNVAGPGMIEISASGKALVNTSGVQCTLAYRTSQATPL
jgi:hypothetical protein